MKKNSAIVMIIAVAIGFGLTVGSLNYITDVNSNHVDLLVGFEPSSNQNQLISTIADYGGKILKKFDMISAMEISLPSSMIAKISQLNGIRYVEENQRYYPDVIPNDPQWSSLWGMQRIQADKAWDITTGSNTVVVAVIDEGIDINHPDLAANIWVNPNEIPGNGIDDDGNGFVDDVNGWNFVDNTGQVYGGDPTQDTHGTHVAGTIGAVGNNGIGVVGVNWNVKIMSLKFLGPQGGSTADGISAIQYATQMGADIISASWGGGGFSQAMKDAIDAFPGLFVAAAGNSGTDNDASPHYPSSYTSANLIAVASSTSTDAMSSFSNYGATSVDIAAPGSSILSTYPNNNYNTISGTSMATPHVSGAAALLLANDPTLTPLQLKQKLMDNVDPVPAFNGKIVSGGILNVYRALTGAAPPPPPPTQTDTFTGTVSSGSPDQVHYFDVTDTTSNIDATLSWGTSADLDMYLYAPGANVYGTGYVVRAYTTANPESLTYTPTQTGTWAIRVNHYSGVSSSYTLDVTYPVSGAPPADTTAPTVTINSPTGTVSGTVTVDATITDNVGVVSADYRVDGGAWVAMTNSAGSSWTASLDTTTLADGTHTLEVRGLDAAGNVGTSSGSFTSSNAPPADTTAPTVTINSPTGTVSGTVTVDATITDNVGVVSADYRVDGGAWVTMTNSAGSSWTASLDTTTLADGAHTLEVRGLDAAGNVGTSSGSFTSSNAPPPSSGHDVFTGSVSSTSPNQIFYFDVTATGDIVATLSWASG
ncbi:MAG: hypothetical protein D6732_22745, partial [Methanobacteriota archaeon]